MLLRSCPDPATSEERRVRQQLKALLEDVAAHQEESSASRQRLERGRAGAPSAHGLNPPPPQQQEHGGGVVAVASAVKRRLGPNHDARNTIEARRRAEASTAITTVTRATTTIVGAADATTTTASAAGHQASGVHGLSAGASVTPSSPRASGPRPTYRDTMGTPTPAYGSRTTDSHATPVGRPMISS
jgi:hypothetical protein